MYGGAGNPARRFRHLNGNCRLDSEQVISQAFERLPPTIAVVLLFVGLVLPQALLGLPVAAAEIGPLPTLAMLLGIGAVMTFAAAAEAESLVRDSAFRAGGQYFGKLVERYLGPRAAVPPDLLAGLRTSMSVLASYVGISVTLAALTGVPRVAIGVVTLAAVALLMARGGLRIPASVGAVLGLASLPLIAGIGLLAVLHGGGGFDTPDGLDGAGIGMTGGLIVMLYISNVYIVNIARDTLPRSPEGRALIRGSAAGTILLTAIAAAWLMATSAAVGPAELTGENGTVLGPLSDVIGPAVAIPGALVILLLLGLGIERTSVAVTNLVAERLRPSRRGAAVLAPLCICLLGEAMLAADAVTFAGVFGVAGVATNILLAVAVPALLLLASRRDGDHPVAVRVPVFGRPVVVGLTVAVVGAGLTAYMTVLADSPAIRVGAGVSLVALILTVTLATGLRSAEPRKPPTWEPE